MEKQLRKNIVKHLHYLHPHLLFVEKSMKENADPNQAFAQIRAAEAHIQKIIYVHFDELLRKHLALTLNRLLTQCEHCPQTLQTLTGIKSRFPHYKINDLPKILHQLKKIEQHFNA